LGRMESNQRLLGRDFALICSSNFLAFFSIYMIIPVLPVFLEDQGYNNFLIGALMSMMTVAALLRPFLGRLSDRSGRRRLVIGGILLLGLSNFAYAAFGSALPLFMVRFINGFGLAAFHTAAYAMISDLAPSSRRLQAIALFYISVDATIATAPLLAEYLRVSWGYTPVYVVAGALALAAFLGSLFVREVHGEGKPRKAGTGRAKMTALHLSIYTMTICYTLTLGSLQTFIVLSALKNGIEQGWLFFTVFAGTLIIFRLGMGRRADDFSRRPLILVSGIVALVGLVIIAYAGHLSFLILGSFVYALGLAYLPTALSALLLDHTPVSDHGAVLGIFLAVFDLGMGIGGFAMGPIADAWSYPIMYVAGGVIAFLGMLFFALNTGTLRAGENVVQTDEKLKRLER
jgi:MFS family permease